MKKEYLRVFRAFSDENRVQILEILCKGEQCACVLLEQLQISQPTLSHHMKLLCQSGIVKSRKVGPWNYYSINEEGCDYASRLLQLVAQKKLSKTVEFVGALYAFVRKFSKKKAGAEKRDCCCVGKQKTESDSGCGCEYGKV